MSSGPDTWIKYAGGHDIGGGLYHYGARFYQPSSGRWTQQDPLLQPGDLRQSNRYVYYAAGDPVNYNDPSGQIIPLVAPRELLPFASAERVPAASPEIAHIAQ